MGQGVFFSRRLALHAFSIVVLSACRRVSSGAPCGRWYAAWKAAVHASWYLASALYPLGAGAGSSAMLFSGVKAISNAA